MTAEMVTAVGALILGISSFVSAILLNRKTIALLEQRMKNVETKLDSHNGYARLFSESSERIAKIETDVAWIKTTLTNLQKGDGHN